MTDKERKKLCRPGLAILGTGSLAAWGGKGGADDSTTSGGETAQALGAQRSATATLISDTPSSA